MLATLIPSLGLGVLSFQQNEAIISENVTHELRALANHASRELDLWTKDQVYIAREISTSKILIESLSLTNQSQKNKFITQQKVLEHYLKSVHKKLETVLELTVINTDGEIIASDTESPAPVLLPPNWPESASIQGDVVVPPHWNARYTTATLSISVPVLSMDDFILGALIVTFDLRNIQSSLKDSVKSPPGEILLLDRNGNVMLASNISALDTDSAASIDSAVLQRLQDNPGEFKIFQGLLQEKVIGLAYTSEKPPITIIASRSHESIYAAWEQQRNLFIGLISAILLIVTSIAFRMGHAIVVPLQRLINATERIVKGDLDVELTTSQRNELGQLTLMFNQMTDKLRQNQTEITAASTAMQQKNQLLETLSITDGLTGLYNRNKLNLIINDQLARYARNKRPFAVLMIDVDYFKTLNDSLGHIAGDEILVSVAKKIFHCIRSVDFAARYGGDEFIIILTETTVNEAMKTAERIRSHVIKIYCDTINEAVKVTLSVGIIQSEPEDTSLTILLSRVDSALYEAKRAGRNQAYCLPSKSSANSIASI
ncbi:MAG: diguanylate cyclase [Nitrosomonas sp.]|nr:diguanylate cyclase [Nitrosomonas sp.]